VARNIYVLALLSIYVSVGTQKPNISIEEKARNTDILPSKPAMIRTTVNQLFGESILMF
jgi:hypothetical protein